MQKPLYIAEKKDVASRLADFLSKGKAIKRDGYFETPDGVLLTYAQGHLLESQKFDEILMQRGAGVSKSGSVSWSHPKTLAILPAVPDNYKIVPSADGGKRKQLAIVVELIGKASEIIHTGDCDREGQSIVDNILMHAGVFGKRKIHRVFFSALDDASIAKALKNVMDNDDQQQRGMYAASEGRRRADYLIGMNLTMAMSTRHSNFEQGVIPIGRVQSPTLFMLVKRFLDNKNFVSKDFYVPQAEINGAMFAFDTLSDSVSVPPGAVDEAGRIISRDFAQSIVDKINKGLIGQITAADKKERKQAPPLPYSLPEIQSEMAKRYGFKVQDITEACQSLYLNELQSYVGTDCRYLPTSMHEEAPEVLRKLQGKYREFFDDINVERKYECWNDKKVGAHHAIIPTGVSKPITNEIERVVYDEVCRRYLMQFMPEHRYMSITAKADFEGIKFSCSEKQPIEIGWKSLDSKSHSSEDEATQQEQAMVDNAKHTDRT